MTSVIDLGQVEQGDAAIQALQPFTATTPIETLLPATIPATVKIEFADPAAGGEIRVVTQPVDLVSTAPAKEVPQSTWRRRQAQRSVTPCRRLISSWFWLPTRCSR